MNPKVTKRCVSCDENWPTADQYSTCPLCQQPTDRVEGLMYAMTFDEARKLVEAHKAELQARDRRNADFEAYYAERAVLGLYSDLEAWEALTP